MKRLFQSLAGTGDGAIVIDRQHRIIFWNQAAEGILGFAAAEVVGRPCYEILGWRQQHRPHCRPDCPVVTGARHSDVLPSWDVCARNKKVEKRWLNVTTFTYPVADGPFKRVVVHLFRDVTETKNYERFVDRILAASERLHQDETPRITPAAPKETPRGRLPPREQQVLELLAQGLGTDKIAKSLTVSPSTVRNHVQNVLGKLGVHSRLEAIAYAYQRGMIEGRDRW